MAQVQQMAGMIKDKAILLDRTREAAGLIGALEQEKVMITLTLEVVGTGKARHASAKYEGADLRTHQSMGIWASQVPRPSANTPIKTYITTAYCVGTRVTS